MQIHPAASRFPDLSQPRCRRVLIVTPHFAPTNAPDGQRVRTALPYLREFGWEAHVLSVQPDQVEHCQDPALSQTLPPDVPVTRVSALPTRYTRPMGLGNLGLRCLPFMQREGDRLLSTQAFDLVFFSTTIFPVMALGDRWQRRFHIPYVLDFQDPWRSNYRHSSTPPGGRFKYAIVQAMAHLLEPRAMQRVQEVISVSPAYPQVLQRRYPWLRPEQFTVLPFGAPEADFEQLPHMQVRQQVFDPHDGHRHWVYVGRGGADMATALRALFGAIRLHRDRDPDCWRSIRLHFVGTSYAPGNLAAKSVEAIAQAYQLADLVTEHPHRIPYFEAQQVLVDSDAILVIGSDDPSYTASKLYPCVLARKPLLAVFHHQSSVVEILRQCQAGRVATFDRPAAQTNLIHQLTFHLDWLLSLPKGYQPPTNWAAFQPYTAHAMTQQLCQVFDRSLLSSRS
ncbi:MAG: glycosyltransferase [Oscillatoriophycideae cyanobacterium NC_groundwater_1537_Pr4_S-0.65um_50_18]|nr:glycosyltransferase [Oscillatoriophycideae cyanobacterium NC_groundwater_1537_Pr4_S-0.65um_50_18]